MNSFNELLSALLMIAPDLQSDYEEHVAENGEVLPHVFMGDVSRFVIQLYRRSESHPGGDEDVLLKQVLDLFENAMHSGSREIREVISASFLENIALDASASPSLRLRLGSSLELELKAILNAWGEE